MGGSLYYEELENNIFKKFPNYKESSVFVESGTYKGDTTREMGLHFKRVITIEINETLYEKSREDGKHQDNVIYILGDSVRYLKTISKRHPEKCIYFLDAHKSGYDSSCNGKSVPLLDELESILPYCKNENVFIIDDCRFFYGLNEPDYNWIGISENSIKDLFKKYEIQIKADYVENDRYIILT